MRHWIKCWPPMRMLCDSPSKFTYSRDIGPSLDSVLVRILCYLAYASLSLRKVGRWLRRQRMVKEADCLACLRNCCKHWGSRLWDHPAPGDGSYLEMGSLGCTGQAASITGASWRVLLAPVTAGPPTILETHTSAPNSEPHLQNWPAGGSH